MNTEITWRPENVEENVEMIKSTSTAEHQSETKDIDETSQGDEYNVHSRLLTEAKAPRVAVSKKKQRQLGPAPIASFEDISDEMDASGTPSHLPGIEEQSETKSSTMSSGAAKLSSKQMTLDVTKTTPRIDISRASSSSQHEDSRDSSPENVFDQIGTGTLQDNTIELGFREDGALELRSSTEELYFMEPERQPGQQLQQQCRSPVTVRVEDQTMDQYQRKDSVSSEVAALLCISGRTSRISSVGSQGSAASRLSAISGISRSPSPHKMILETSFCGPKPVDMPLGPTETRPADALEQILLARKHDPTQAVFAEGIIVKSLNTDERATKDKKNGAVVKSARKPKTPIVAPEVKITRPQAATKPAVMDHKKIVGKTESGTEYIRIKLKPDELYEDQGLAPNEKLVDDMHVDSLARKPVSLNIKKQTKTDLGPPSKPSSSPKPSKHIFGLGKENTGSRSPSPATVLTTSRKNSFCSLFKSKDATSTPDSPTAFQIRKKSSASARENDEAHSHRSRSCGKIKDMEKLSPSPTPSKQKSVLGIFKTKRSGSASKSKSTSPVDEDRRVGGTSPVTPFYSAQQPQGKQTAATKTRLRYYETPADNSGIYIPLHTPPDEKDVKVEDDAVAKYNQMLDKQLHETELGRSILRSMNKPIETPESSPKHTQVESEAQLQKQDEIVAAPKISPSPARKATELVPKTRKSSRIEYPDGSIRIPLRSPSEEEPPHGSQVCEVQVECVPQPVKEPLVTKTNPPQSPPPLDIPVEPEVHCVTVEAHSKNSQVAMVPLPREIPDQQIEEMTQPQPPPPTPASVTNVQPNREKKHILFTTKLGSNEEQQFQTQFSVSKTESMCSPTSEANNTQEESSSKLPEDNKDDEAAANQTSGDDMAKGMDELPSEKIASVPSVIVQIPQAAMTRRRSSQLRCEFSTEDEMSLKEPAKVVTLQTTQSEVAAKAPEEVVKQRYTETMDYKLGPQRTSTTEETAVASSGSDRDSETCTDTTVSRKHLAHNLAIDEHESTGLVSQISYEDELPYVPTTLPEERSVAVPIISIRERATMEVKTYPVDRPRSTTPLNPSFLDDYCGPDVETPTNARGEKLKISLPRKDSRDKIQKPKSPRRVSNSSGKSWFEYEARGETNDQFEEPPPPPLPPRAAAAHAAAAGTNTTQQWINFENIPEKRKPPKRITTVPHKDPTMVSSSSTVADSTMTTTVYQFVKPDECQCECHEMERKVAGSDTQSPATTSDEPFAEEGQPLLGGGGTDSKGDSTGKSDGGGGNGEGCNSMSDLSTDYSSEEFSGNRELDFGVNSETTQSNTACKSFASCPTDDSQIMSTCQKTEQQRPFQFDLNVSMAAEDKDDEEDDHGD